MSWSLNNSVFEQKIRDENDSVLEQLEQKKEQQRHVTAKTKRKHFSVDRYRDTIHLLLRSALLLRLLHSFLFVSTIIKNKEIIKRDNSFSNIGGLWLLIA